MPKVDETIDRINRALLNWLEEMPTARPIFRCEVCGKERDYCPHLVGNKVCCRECKGEAHG